uniref:Protein ALP1-like n=1 Tax=Tanacetum cinerariifolium TaxID=118510 RepID=A0A699I3T5_TANCI|nr:hypothetical protein [Tanacetum cinerariifolium]
MNSHTFMCLDDVEEGEEISSREKSFIKQAITFIKIRRQANRVTRNSITRDRVGAHEHLVATFFLRTRCTMQLDSGRHFECINASFLDEYMQISGRASHMSLDHFCKAVMDIYGLVYLRKPTVTDIEKLYRRHKEKNGFPGMLESLDCTDWEWFGCTCVFKGPYVKRYHGSNPFILLEAVASQDLWIWYTFFGVVGSNNDINVLYQSPLFNDLKTGRAPEILFVANSVSYPSGYYLVDGIYPQLAPLVKMIPKPADDYHKRILYKQNKNRQGNM